MNDIKINPGRSYAIIPEFLFDALEDHSRTGMAVIIENGRIGRVCPASEIPADMQWITLADGTLIPGMIDAHVHLDDWELPYYLAYGITTVRDVGNSLPFILDARKKAADPSFPSPSIVCCGPFIDKMPYYHANMSWGMENSRDIEVAMRCLKMFSVDYIKLYNDLTPEMAAKAVIEAKKSGFYVLADFGSKAVLDAALEAGLDEFEHLFGLPDEFSQEAADAVLSRGTRMVATRALFENILPDRFRTPEGQAILKNVPENIAAYWLGTLDFRNEAFIKACGTKREYLKYFIENHANLGIGTDTACWWMFPGMSYADELQVHVECGLSCADTLKLATARNAETLRLESRIGTIEAGKRADLAFVKGDPLAGIKAVGHVLLTVKEGHLFDPAELILQSQEAKPVSNSLRDFGSRAPECSDWKSDREIAGMLEVL